MQKWLVCQKRGGRRPVLPCFNCISALVCQDTQESIALGCVLNPQCTPTGPSHSLHARAVAALFACSHSICNDTKSFFFSPNVEHEIPTDARRTTHVHFHPPVFILYFLLDVLQGILGNVSL